MIVDAKKRWIYFAFILLTILAGLSTRIYGYKMPYLIAEYGGDTLFAVCIFWTVRFLFLQLAIWKTALWSWFMCIMIEVSQLYQAPWIQRIRSTAPFILLLGSDFVWSDWICYTIGIVMALLLCSLIERRNRY